LTNKPNLQNEQNTSVFPQELMVLPNWLNWRLEPDKKSGRDMKVPYNPTTGYKASTSNSSTWGTLDAAVDAQQKYLFSGLGFVFTTECGIIGIDIDKCLTDIEVVDADGSGESSESDAEVARIVKQPNEVAAAILEKVPPTYIEISPSGRGLHIFLRGEMPRGGNKNSEHGVEMYGNKRYFTMTGNRWMGYADNSGEGSAGRSDGSEGSAVALNPCVDQIALDNGSIQWIFETFIKPKRGNKSNNSTANASNSTETKGKSTLSDDSLLGAVRASNDRATFEKLWSGNWQGKYPSQSEADFALCCKLAFWANHDLDQMDRLFRKSGLFRDKWDTRHHASGDTYGTTTLRNACAKTPETYKPKRKRQVSIFEQDGSYYRLRGEAVTQLTNFTIRPIEFIFSDDEAQLVCDFITNDGEEYRLTLSSDDFANMQKFKKVLNKRTIALCYFGTDGDLETFKQFVHGLEWKRKKGVKALGIYNHNKNLVFVSPTGAVGAGGIAVDTIIQMEKYKELESAILDKPFINADELKKLGSLLLTSNEPAKTTPVLAWAAGCFIKPHLRRNEAKYPHLFLVGEQGGGKSTTLERVILPIFSRSKVFAASQMTTFSIMKESNSSNVMPQSIDEFKPSKLDKFTLNTLYNHFRDTYDLHDGIRGRADQTTVKYELLAPIVVAGEESADEAAIRERSIELLFTKKDVENADYENIFNELTEKATLLGAFGRTLLDVALSTTPKEVGEWYAEGRNRFKGIFASRITNNLSCMYAGLKLVEKLCTMLKLSWNYVFPFDLEVCSNHLIYSVRQYLLSGSTHNMTLVEQTFEVMSRIGLKAGKDFVFECAGRHICFRSFRKIYDRYTKYRKDYAILGEVLRVSDFYKQLTFSKYFVSNDREMRIEGKVCRVWVVDFEKLSQICDVSGFLEAQAEKDDEDDKS